jgi:hypothetical protein
MSAYKVAKLKEALKCFRTPDSHSEVLAHLPAQAFNVLEVRERYPNADTDYLRLATPGVGTGEAWICSRWEQHHYADVETREIDDFTGDPMAIPESFLLARLRDFAGYEYQLKDPLCYPWPLPGATVNTLPPKKINCCTFVEGLLVKAWEDAVGSRLHWSQKSHNQMMINGTDDYFSPIAALIEAGMAVPVEATAEPPPPWTVIQGWREQWAKGHTFILVAQRNGKVLTLEANESYKMKGVGHRGLGNAESFGFSPPPKWWEDPEVWTWDQIRNTYRFHKLARLKLTQLQWVT